MTGAVSPSTVQSPAELGLSFPSPQPLWQCSFAALAEARTTAELSGPWRLLLLGDGSPTRHLELLTGAPVEVELIAMAPDSAGDSRVPAEVAELSPPLLRRQVWLRCGGQALAWAESWWNQTEAEQSLRDRQLPIWRSLSADRAELFREVDGLARVQASWLQQGFGEEGPYWSRHYRFFRGGRELTVIREVFSPALERWLGPSSPSSGS
ncbi:MAG: chorismate lyase [Cyanobacteria bacterium]|nr:chorismate lyase [Cyanobacteria bacterium bin.51]